jgi:hypothetical protein
LFLHDRRVQAEIAALPAVERTALYDRTLATLRTVCAGSSGPQVADYCQDPADFVVGFPDCDQACRDLARRFEPQPTK